LNRTNNEQFSVCIPTYNREKDLKILLDSIPKTVKVNISDNGSFLNEIVQSENIKIEKQMPILTMFENWNASARLANSEYIFITSDDDIYYENAFKIVQDALKSAPNLDLYIWGHDTVDEMYRVIKTNIFTNKEFEIFRTGEAFQKNPYSLPYRMPSICIRRDFAESLGFFNTEFKYTASDSEFLQKLLLLGTCYIGKSVIAGYRVWENNATSLTNATNEWFVELELWVNNIIKIAIKNDKTHMIPKNYKEKIMYENVRSAVSTMKKNSKSMSEQLAFVLMVVKKRYIRNALSIAKVVLRVFIK